MARSTSLSRTQRLERSFAAEPHRAPAETPDGAWLARHRIDGRVVGIDGEPDFTARDDDLVGYGLIDRMHADDRPRFLDALRAAADGLARTTTLRLRGADADDYALMEATSRIAPTQFGAGVMITSFRRGDPARELIAALEAAREEARVERSLKDRLLANMSHELRTPLNAILGFSEILGDPELAPTDPEKRFEYAKIIHTSADHLLSVVNLVLDMSRIEAGKFPIQPEPMELAPFVSECCDMLRLRAKSGAVEILNVPLADNAEIIADKRACRQIVVNLLSNAVKFTPPNGRVSFEVRMDDDVARFVVTDTGVGIKPDDMARLGDPFYQVRSGYDRSFEGAGLGLSLVRGLVGLHNGSLLLESAFGVGTRVTATLPRVSRPLDRQTVSARLQTIPHLTLPAALSAGAMEEERRIA